MMFRPLPRLHPLDVEVDEGDVDDFVLGAVEKVVAFSVSWIKTGKVWGSKCGVRCHRTSKYEATYCNYDTTVIRCRAMYGKEKALLRS